MSLCQYCYVENEWSETTGKIKAGCGHLVSVCHACLDDKKEYIQHNRCDTCAGRLTPEEELEVGRFEYDHFANDYDCLDDFEPEPIEDHHDWSMFWCD